MLSTFFYTMLAWTPHRLPTASPIHGSTAAAALQNESLVLDARDSHTTWQVVGSEAATATVLSGGVPVPWMVDVVAYLLLC